MKRKLFSIIPIALYSEKSLTAVEKLVLTEINSLDVDGGCTASDEYLGKIFGISTGSMRDILSSLRKKEWIKTVAFDGRKRVMRIERKKWQKLENKSIGISIPNLLNEPMADGIETPMAGIGNSPRADIGDSPTIDHSIDHSIEPPTSPQGEVRAGEKDLLEKRLEEIWTIWSPAKRTSRKSVREALKSALKRLPFEKIIAAARQYVKSPLYQSYIQRKEFHFIPGLPVWLNQDRWEEAGTGAWDKPKTDGKTKPDIAFEDLPDEEKRRRRVEKYKTTVSEYRRQGKSEKGILEMLRICQFTETEINEITQ